MSGIFSQPIIVFSQFRSVIVVIAVDHFIVCLLYSSKAVAHVFNTIACIFERRRPSSTYYTLYACSCCNWSSFASIFIITRYTAQDTDLPTVWTQLTLVYVRDSSNE